MWADWLKLFATLHNKSRKSRAKRHKSVCDCADFVNIIVVKRRQKNAIKSLDLIGISILDLVR